MIQTLTELRLQVFERSPLARILRRRLDAKFTQADVEKVLRELAGARLLRDRLRREILRERDPEVRLQLLLGRTVRERIKERLPREAYERLLGLMMSELLPALYKWFSDLLNSELWDRLSWPWGAVVEEEPIPEFAVDWGYEDPSLDLPSLEDFLKDLLDWLDDLGEIIPEEIPEEPRLLQPEPVVIDYREPRAVTEAVAPVAPAVRRWEILDQGQAVGVGLEIPGNSQRAYVSPPFSGPCLVEHVELGSSGNEEAHFAVRVVSGGIDAATVVSGVSVSGYALLYSSSNYLSPGADVGLAPWQRFFDWWPGLILGDGSYRLYMWGRNLGTTTVRASLIADVRQARLVG